MKRISSIVLVLAFLIGIMQIAVPAQSKVENLVPANEAYEVHYYISDNIPLDMRAKILAQMSGAKDSEPEQDRNILCTLFGHKYEETGSSYTVTHNVYTTSPKCVRNAYTTYNCTRCGDVKTELTSSERISTCHG